MWLVRVRNLAYNKPHEDRRAHCILLHYLQEATDTADGAPLGMAQTVDGRRKTYTTYLDLSSRNVEPALMIPRN